jgi:hypothetical protein
MAGVPKMQEQLFGKAAMQFPAVPRNLKPGYL